MEVTFPNPVRLREIHIFMVPHELCKICICTVVVAGGGSNGSSGGSSSGNDSGSSSYISGGGGRGSDSSTAAAVAVVAATAVAVISSPTEVLCGRCYKFILYRKTHEKTNITVKK